MEWPKRADKDVDYALFSFLLTRCFFTIGELILQLFFCYLKGISLIKSSKQILMPLYKQLQTDWHFGVFNLA